MTGGPTTIGPRMQPRTGALWRTQDQHEGDRHRLFRAVADVIPATRVLYAGSYADVAPSFVFPSVTYVDMDDRAARFFADDEGVREIIAAHDGPSAPEVTFIHGDYGTDLGIAEGSFDLLVSLYAGFVSDVCTRYLRVGGTLLVNPSHGDAALASFDPRFVLRGVVVASRGTYRVRTDDLGTYLVPKSGLPVTAAAVRAAGRGVAYTKPAFAYLFERVA